MKVSSDLIDQEVKTEKHFWLGVVVLVAQLVLASVVALVGFSQLGAALFVATPLSVGAVAGFINTWNQMWKLLGVLLAVPSIILVFVGIEGLLCVVMAAPILAVMLAVGYAIGTAFRRDPVTPADQDSTPINKATLMFPFAIYLVSASAEQFIITSFEDNQATTQLVVPYPQDQVFAAIAHVDTVTAPLTWMHTIGLPIPYASHVDSLAVGGLRNCYLSAGIIRETITELDAPYTLAMDMNDESVGRPWLKLAHDTYNLETLANGDTRITHTTDFTSTLRPRAYWAYIERLTVKAQHQVVFDNLAIDLKARQ